MSCLSVHPTKHFLALCPFNLCSNSVSIPLYLFCLHVSISTLSCSLYILFYLFVFAFHLLFSHTKSTLCLRSLSSLHSYVFLSPNSSFSFCDLFASVPLCAGHSLCFISLSLYCLSPLCVSSTSFCLLFPSVSFLSIIALPHIFL